jgi:hypothetical protein
MRPMRSRYTWREASNLGFTTIELRRVQRLVVLHEAQLLEAGRER